MSAPTAEHSPTMEAIVAPRYGSADVLEQRTIGRPTPGPGEVLLEVRAAGISRAALHLLTGLPKLLRLAYGLRAPKQPVVGIEASGTVVEVGPGVTRVRIGQEVFGYAPGSCARYAVAKADKLAQRPDGLAPTDAAALVDSASTALQACERAQLQLLARVLVLGASGGVGAYVVQLAKGRGAHVTGTASTAKVDFVRSLGADDVIDHRTADPLDAATPFDVIIDIGGNRSVKALRRALAPGGTLVFVGGEEGGSITGGFGRQLLAPLRSIGSRQRLVTFVAKEHHASLDAIADLAVSGQLRAVVDQVHPLAATADAFRRMEAGEICGKDVIAVR